MEKPVLILTMFNPLDLARILVILKMDISALLGYTGAVFKDFFGTTIGYIISFLVLILWIVIPSLLSIKYFNNKDL